jgi:hypothetical protein
VSAKGKQRAGSLPGSDKPETPDNRSDGDVPKAAEKADEESKQREGTPKEAVVVGETVVQEDVEMTSETAAEPEVGEESTAAARTSLQPEESEVAKSPGKRTREEEEDGGGERSPKKERLSEEA